ncbi:outer membrane beta-barrel protein [Agaribacterium sp. ZY112]|uniref:outer membrane beta-barrel protein n=1 Tax=Agaribacterium sp. ZY112 TaxID=3233574 RepID=UPI003524C818
MKKFRRLSLLGLAGCITAPGVMAEKFDPAPINLSGSLKLVPTVEAAMEHSDNIYDEEFDGTSSNILVVKPDFALGTDDGVNRYGVRYSLTSGTVYVNSDDDYLDHRFSALAHIEPNSKNRLDIDASYNKLHEDRGSGLSEGRPDAIDKPVEYDMTSANARYQFGAESSRARIGGKIGYYSKEYTNFREYSAARDTDQNNYGLDFELGLGDVTALTLDGVAADIRFPHIGTTEASRDSTDNRAFIGLKWEALAKTTGKAKVGYQVKDFDSESREDFSGTAVDIGFTWEPKTYSSIDFSLGQVAKDPTSVGAVGDYIDERYLLLAWNHGWTSTISTDFKASYSDEDYIGSGGRHDETTGFSAELNYAFARWLKGGLGYDFTDKVSTAENITFDKNVYSLSITASL